MKQAWDEELRARGYRVTPQRQLVLEAVTKLEHATPEEICADVQQTARGVNISTIYRALELLEDLGLVVFVAIVGLNAGNSLLAQLTGAIAAKIFVVGFIACTIPPIVVWAIGYHVFKINPAVLMGGVAGARSHSGPCREAAVEIQSNVPWIGFPVGYAVSGILLTVFGYFAMLLAQ